MIKTIKIIAFVCIFLFSTHCANATNIETLVEKSPISKNATIAVSVKNAKTGKVIYEYNQHKLLNPASIQKVFTMRTAYTELGKDFVFQTNAYTDNNNNLYIKLSGDPSLTTGSLISLLTSLENKKYNNIIVDPFVFDNEEWGIGWMWDDNTSELLPKYSPFSINENKISITIKPAINGGIPEIKNNNKYNITILNKVSNGTTNNIAMDRKPWQGTDLVTISGNIKSPINLNVPVNSPERNFRYELETAIKKSNISYDNILIAPTPQDARIVGTISSEPLDTLVAKTLKTSNNFYSEMIFKKAAQQHSKKRGSTIEAVKMLNKYYSNLKSDKIIVVDACGISRNNLITADWATAALNKIFKENDYQHFSTLLPKPIEGTMSDRLLNISLKVRAKTGTASNISSIVGYIDAKNNDKYSFAIIIQNHNNDVSSVKKYEDEIINEIYKL